MQGDIGSQINKILNDVELSDNDKILKILSFPPSLYTSPIGFVSILDIIKEGNQSFIDDHQQIILDFLKNYSACSNDFIEKKSLFKDKFSDILFKYSSDNNSKSLLDNFLTLISSPIYRTEVFRDFDSINENSNLSPLPSPYSSQNSTPTTTPPPSPPPPPPPRLPPVPLLFSALPLPIPTGINSASGELEITAMSKVVSNEADSQEANQVISAIIDDNHQRVLFPLPKRLDPVDERLFLLPQRLGLNDDSASQQNINSSPVVYDHQNQGDDANLAMQNSTASSQATFESPQRLGPKDYSSVSSAMSNDAPVVPLNTDSTTSNQGEPEQDESGEKKTRCFGCLFSRVPLRITRCLPEIKMSGILKFISARCLGSLTRTRVRPGP